MHCVVLCFYINRQKCLSNKCINTGARNNNCVVIINNNCIVISWHSGLFSWANIFSFSQQMHLLTQTIVSVSITIKSARSINFPYVVSLKVLELFIKKKIQNHIMKWYFLYNSAARMSLHVLSVLSECRIHPVNFSFPCFLFHFTALEIGVYFSLVRGIAHWHWLKGIKFLHFKVCNI